MNTITGRPEPAANVPHSTSPNACPPSRAGRLAPGLTPGRAFFWGGVLAVWGTAALVAASGKGCRLNVKPKQQAAVLRTYSLAGRGVHSQPLTMPRRLHGLERRWKKAAHLVVLGTGKPLSVCAVCEAPDTPLVRPCAASQQPVALAQGPAPLRELRLSRGSPGQ